MSKTEKRIDFRSLLIWTAIIMGIAWGLTRSRSTLGILPVYTEGTQRMAAGQEVYIQEGNAFTYPPFWALMFTPLAWLGEQTQKMVWCVLNVSLLVWIGHRLIDRLRPVLCGNSGPPAWVYGLGLALLAGRFVISPLEYQAHDIVIFALVWAGIEGWCRWRTHRAGVFWGLAAACKATPLLFAPLMLWHRRWASAAFGGIVLVAATLGPDVVFPRPDGKLWSVAWVETFVSKVSVGGPADVGETWKSWDKLNQSLGGTLYRLSTQVPNEGEFIDVHLWQLSPKGIKVLTLICQVLILVYLAFITWPKHSRNLSDDEKSIYRLGEAGVILCGMLLLSPMSSKYHFVTLVVPIALCWGDFLYRKRDPLVGVAMGLVLVLGTLTAKSLLGKPLGDKIQTHGSITLCTLTVMLCTGHVIYHRAKAMHAQMPPDETGVKTLPADATPDPVSS